MSHRLHVTIASRQFEYLEAEANRSSVSVAELVRRALDTTYGPDGERRVLSISHVVGRRAGRRVEETPPPSNTIE